MKIYNLAIPVFIAFFLTNISPSNIENNTLDYESSTIEIVETEKTVEQNKQPGILTGEQDLSNCNLCNNCSHQCLLSEDACIGATIEVTDLYCPFESPQGTLSFPGNSQFICSITQTGPYTWYLEFNAIAYSCNEPGSPYKFDIPMQYTFGCSSTDGGVLNGSVHFTIC